MPTHAQDIGPRVKVAVLEAAKDGVAAAINEHIAKEGMTLPQFMHHLRVRHGWRRRRTQEVSCFLRNSPNSRWGVFAAFELAETVGIPIEVAVAGRQVAA